MKVTQTKENKTTNKNKWVHYIEKVGNWDILTIAGIETQRKAVNIGVTCRTAGHNSMFHVDIALRWSAHLCIDGWSDCVDVFPPVYVLHSAELFHQTNLTRRRTDKMCLYLKYTP